MSGFRSPPSSALKATPPQQQHQGRRGGRKEQQQDLNHLLGFTLPPRQPQPALTHLPRRSNNRNSGRSGGGAHGGGAFDRSRFVHTFRFIVKPDKDYTAHFADPDLHLDWPDILQVILPTTSSALRTVTTGARMDQASEDGKSACPICLSEPTAARMTKCGHVFCYPCVLHYLALADPGIKFRKCPVCHDSIYAKDLKSVKWFDPVKGSPFPSSSSSAAPPAPHPHPGVPCADPIDAELARVLELSKLDAHPHPALPLSSSSSDSPTTPRGERLTLRLIRRPQLTTLALPRSSTWPSDTVPPLRAPWQFSPDALAYAKFMLGEPSYLRDELLSQRAELERELASLRRFKGTDEELGTVFVVEALRKIDEQVAKTELLKTTPVMTARKKARRELEEIEEERVEEEKARSAAPALAAPLAPPVPPVDSSSSPLELLSARSPSGGSTPLSSTALPFTPSSSSSTSSDPPPSAPPAFPSSPPSSSKRSPHPRRNVLPTLPSPETDPSYFFYQASSGQPIFLSPLDIKALKSHFGTYAAMPDTITVSVEGADEGSMNDELRRRCKWLSHLPRGSDVVFVEADLSGIVPRKALEPFAQALKSRRQKRRDKARKEENARKRSETKAREELPVFYSTYAHGEAVPLPLSMASSSSWEDTAAFPAPPSVPRATPPAAAQAAGGTRPSSAAQQRPSFASALHASSRSTPQYGSAWDDEYDDRWDELEEELGRQRAGTPRGSAVAGAAGGGGGAKTPPAGNLNVSEGSGGQAKKGKKGRKGGITLSLTGMSGRA
ncbi:hypothetical protein JCM8547_003179 [Rhodosporidiobolus lusitaniae]